MDPSNNIRVNAQIPPPISTKFLTTGDYAKENKEALGKHYQEITAESIVNFVCQGEDLFKKIINNDDSILFNVYPNDSPETKTKNAIRAEDNIRSLLWYLEVNSRQMDEKGHSDAAMHAFADRDNKIFNYILNCGKALPGQFYPRISSHYKTTVVDQQYGIDLKNLPNRKGTFLIGHRRDGSTFIKMEDHGCAPFWSKGFRNAHNVINFFEHSLGFIRSLGQMTGVIAATEGARKEKVAPKIAKIFKENIALTEETKKQHSAIKEGAKKMYETLESINESVLTMEGLMLKQKLKARLDQDARIGIADVVRQADEILHKLPGQ